MNIVARLVLNDDKPAISQVRDTAKTNILSIGLKKDQVLKRHLSTIPAFIVVLQGEIDFELEGKVTRLSQFETFEIPVRVLHEVRAVSESFFLLIKEKEQSEA